MKTAKEIETLDKQILEIKQAKEELNAEGERLQKELHELTVQADAAAEAGNIDQYMSIQSQIDRAKAASHIRTVQLQKKAQPITKRDAQVAWAAFAVQYNKAMKVKLEAIAKAKATLLNAYREAVELQSEACDIREHLGDAIGLRFTALDLAGTALKSAFPMANVLPNNTGLNQVTLRVGGYGILDKDLAFFIANLHENNMQLYKDSNAKRYISIVGRQGIK